MKKLLSIACLFILLSAFGCAKQEPNTGGKLNVVTSIYPVYEFTRAVAGEHTNVTLLLPPGAEAHDWEPTPAELKKINTADLFFYNGGGMEPWAQALAENANAGKPVFVETGKGLMTRTSVRGTPDPHIWLSPQLAQKQVELIRDMLVQADPEHKKGYEQQALAYNKKLAQLDEDYKKLAAKTQGKAFITMHAAFGYLASLYGWEQIPLMGIAPHAEPNPSQMAKIMQTAQEKNIRYIFVEHNVSDKVMREIANETNTQLLVLDTVEGPLEKDPGYLQRMQNNLQSFAQAFGAH